MRLSTVATVLAVLALPTIASAHAGNNDPNVVHACINNNSNIVRIVGVSGSCLPPETPAHWDIQGPQGVPGTNGINGINGTNGIDGKDGTNATRADGPCFDNTNRYVDCGNGTITDTVTGLIWLKDAACLGSTNWAAANQAAAGLKDSDCGGTLTDKSSAGDWRLPTESEWNATIASAIPLGCLSAYPTGPLALHPPPSLTNDAGIACQSVGPSSFVGASVTFNMLFWSSTTNETNPVVAWLADLRHGLVGPQVGSFTKVFNGRVWPVRGGSR